MVLAVPHFKTSKEIQTLAELQSYVYQFTSLTVSSQIDAGVCACIKVAGGGTVEACVVLVCVRV